MEKITITINTENAAFEDGPLFEAAAILRNLAHNWGSGHQPESLYDSNGNKTGSVTCE